MQALGGGGLCLRFIAKMYLVGSEYNDWPQDGYLASKYSFDSLSHLRLKGAKSNLESSCSPARGEIIRASSRKLLMQRQYDVTPPYFPTVPT
jgi:hypothetical protein